MPVGQRVSQKTFSESVDPYVLIGFMNQ